MHPYYPLDLHMPTWQPLAIPFEKILATFFTACGLVMTTGWWLTGSSPAATSTAMQSVQQSKQKAEPPRVVCLACRQGQVPQHCRAQHGVLVPLLWTDPPHH